MSQIRNVAVLVGSLRKESLNRKLGDALVPLAPPSLRLAQVEIGHLPFYNQDFEADPPKAVRSFKERLATFDAVLFITPEYNRSVPAVDRKSVV
jgi:chromate reductase